ncbi:hypothetical protein Flavo103_44480 [Flavobacterium collinsii]|uniref:hypothetical protein n=1 Tax=Flavobacterium collinsii TaxID=1114861 RepID=UPI0022BDCEBE|nr:hypothetical protein [Flavobacterium collinsii]GIQ61313.1 hypothetical protein Flavo103_44480 [Flavobacterium collinsii]
MIRLIKTKENVSNPEIVEFNNVFGYKRGFTFSTNIATFIDQDNVCILSERCEESNTVVIDKYSLVTGNYLSSFQLEKLGKNNKEINNIFQINDKIILNSTNRFYSYLFF